MPYKPSAVNMSAAGIKIHTVDTPLDGSSLESQVYLYVAVVLMGIIIFVGCAGNLMVIVAVRTTKKLQIVSNAFVVNLSVCDLLFVTLILPFNIYTYLTDGWNLPTFLCKAIGFLGYTLTGTTIITITLIAWNRYKLVVNCEGYQRLFSPWRIALMLALAWLVPALILLPALFEVWGRFGYVAMMVTCNLLLDHDSQAFKLFLLIVRAVIPCSLILYYYLSIYRTIKASHRRVRQGRLLVSSFNRFDQAIQRKELHLTKMMATIFIVFAMSYFPCTVSSIVDWNTLLSKRFHMFCLITIYLGSAVNPLIYGLMNSQFRLAYYSILLCQCCRPQATKQGAGASPALCHKVYTKRINLLKGRANQITRLSSPDQTPLSSPDQTPMSSPDQTPLSSPQSPVRKGSNWNATKDRDRGTPVSSPEFEVQTYKKLSLVQDDPNPSPPSTQENSARKSNTRQGIPVKRYKKLSQCEDASSSQAPNMWIHRRFSLDANIGSWKTSSDKASHDYRKLGTETQKTFMPDYDTDDMSDDHA